MNEKQTNLSDKVQSQYLELAQSLRDSGKTPREIEAVIIGEIKRKRSSFYHAQGDPASLKSIMAQIDIKKDSKAEGIFYELLQSSGVDFQFQYKIGPYTADYLVDQDIVVEVDGPTHSTDAGKDHDQARDAYMIKRGYRIVRIPLDILAMDPNAAIDEIQSIIIEKHRGGK